MESVIALIVCIVLYYNCSNKSSRFNQTPVQSATHLDHVKSEVFDTSNVTVTSMPEVG